MHNCNIVTDSRFNPGDFNLDLLDQFLQHSNLRMINCCNELNAGYAADGYARSSKAKIAVVVVTYMVGGLSVLNAIAGAASEGQRVIVICGGPEESDYTNGKVVHHTLGRKDKDQCRRIYDQVCAASIRVSKNSSTKDLDSALNKCLNQWQPVYIEVPVDVARLPFCSEQATFKIRPARQSRKHVVTRALANFQERWNLAERPSLIVGGAARNILPVELVNQVATKLGCPVYCLLDGKSQISESHPSFRGVYWSAVSSDGVEEALDASDLWLTLGCHWHDLHLLGQTLDKTRVFNLRQSAGNQTIRDSELLEVVESLLQLPISVKSTPRNRRKRSIDEDGEGSSRKASRSSKTSLSPDDISHSLTRMLRSEDTLLSDPGEGWFIAAQSRLPVGAVFHVQLLYASTGWALPAAMGCQLARESDSSARTIVLVGDGSYQMTVQETSTLIRHNLNVVVLIVNNHGYQIEVSDHLCHSMLS
jgi:pyruvate decarboxylase